MRFFSLLMFYEVIGLFPGVDVKEKEKERKEKSGNFRTGATWEKRNLGMEE